MAQAEVFESSCPQCGRAFRALSQNGADGALRLHLNKVHGTARRRPPAQAPASPPSPAAPPAPRRAARADPPPAAGPAPHRHAWRALRAEGKELHAIRRGYTRYCPGCGEVE